MSAKKQRQRGKSSQFHLDPYLLSIPFERVAVDLVGPLSHPSSQGHRYILTIIDVAMRYPEAVPLKDISAISVAEALLTIFFQDGILKRYFVRSG